MDCVELSLNPPPYIIIYIRILQGIIQSVTSGLSVTNLHFKYILKFTF